VIGPGKFLVGLRISLKAGSINFMGIRVTADEVIFL
jgi:hypothetical protein